MNTTVIIAALLADLLYLVFRLAAVHSGLGELNRQLSELENLKVG